MDYLRAWLKRLRPLLRRRDAERDLKDEIEFHIAMEIEQHRRDGLSVDEARRRAMLGFGGVERYTERVREERWSRFVSDGARDVLHAGRTLRRSQGFALTVVVTLTVAIGAAAAMFALVDAIVIRPLPYSSADRLLSIEHRVPGLGIERGGISSGLFYHYGQSAKTIEAIGVYDETSVNLREDGTQAERVKLVHADPGLFRVLGANPVVGRLFTEVDGARGFMNMTWPIPVLISHELWQRRYGSDPRIVDREILLNERARRVVGVMPAGFAFPDPETQVWMLTIPPAATAGISRFNYQAIARLRAGATVEQAQAELTTLLGTVTGRFRNATPTRLAELQPVPLVTPLKQHVLGDVAATLWILLAAIGFLLAIAVANVSNLFFVRGEQRDREVAVRAALGARRSHIVRLFLGESLLLTSVACAAGLLLAHAALRIVPTQSPIELPRLHEVRLTPTAIAAAVIISFCASLSFTWVGLLRRAYSRAVYSAINSAGRAMTESRSQARLRNLLVGAQVALAIVLLVGSGLMARSFARLLRVDPGFDPHNVLTMRIGLPGSMASQHRQIYDGIVERIRSLPSVRGAAAVSRVPLSDDAGEVYPMRAVGSSDLVGDVNLVFYTPGYFETIQTAISTGGTNRGAIVSRSLAARLFQGRSPSGQRIRRLQESGEDSPDNPEYTVAGTAADVRDRSLRQDPGDIVYVPIIEPRVEPWIVPTSMTLLIRTDGDPLQLTKAVRDAVEQVSPRISIARVQTLEQIVGRSTARTRFLTLLLVAAAVVALFLGTTGIYGLVAFSVRAREREIGLRTALGARPAQVAALLLRQSGAPILAGGALGLIAALTLTRAMRAQLFEIAPTDPVTLTSAVLLLIVAAVLACVVPVQRALRANPASAMRAE